MGGLFAKPEVVVAERKPLLDKRGKRIPLPENRYEWSDKILGQGEVSVVHFACSKKDGQKVAIKRISPTQLTVKRVQQLYKEAKILNKISRLNTKARFVRLVEGFIDHQGGICLVTNRIAGSELFQAIIRNPKGLPEVDAKYYVFQIFKAVEVLHKNNIAHLDLKLENMMYSRRTKEVSIIDFGFAEETTLVDVETGETLPRKLNSFCGSLDYSAPEILQHIEFDGKKADVWSLGVVVYALLTGNFPFEAKKRHRILEKIVIGDYPIPSGISHTACSLLNQMLQKHPDNRSSISSLLEHEWFAELEMKDEEN